MTFTLFESSTMHAMYRWNVEWSLRLPSLAYLAGTREAQRSMLAVVPLAEEASIDRGTGRLGRTLFTIEGFISPRTIVVQGIAMNQNVVSSISGREIHTPLLDRSAASLAVPITVQLGEVELPLADILRLEVGTIFDLSMNHNRQCALLLGGVELGRARIHITDTSVELILEQLSAELTSLQRSAGSQEPIDPVGQVLSASDNS